MKIDFHVNYKRIILIASTIAFIVASLMFLLVGLTYYLKRSMIKSLLGFYATAYFVLGSNSSILNVFGVSARMKTLNEALMEKLDRKAFKVKPKQDEDEIEMIIKVLIEVYCDLMDAIDLVNVSFAVQCCLGFGLTYFYTLLTVFTVYTDFIGFGYITGESISSICYCIYYNFWLTVLIVLCNILEKEVRKDKNYNVFLD